MPFLKQFLQESMRERERERDRENWQSQDLGMWTESRDIQEK
jgi:hypothetical protein